MSEEKIIMEKPTEDTVEPKTTQKRGRRKGATKATTTVSARKEIPKKKTYNKDDLIDCVSVTVGRLIYSHLDTRSGNQYDWFDFGDICSVEYQDLLAMIARKSEYLFMPRIIINDEDMLENYPKLKEITEKFYGLDDPIRFFDVSPDTLEERITSAPEGLKRAIADMAGGMIKTGEIDSRKKIEIIDKVLGTEFGKLS